MKTQEFINKAKLAHGGRYNYSRVRYLKAHSHVVISCKAHGDFNQSPTNHLSGKGCPHCVGLAKRDTPNFVSAANAVHKNQYSYDMVDYREANTKVSISCKDHGLFSQTPAHHLSGKGCPKCGFAKSAKVKRQLARESFTTKATALHGDRYSYDHVQYEKTSSKVLIVCRHHGVFHQTPNKHLSGQGCSLCVFDRAQTTTLYLLEGGGLIKVGISSNITRRLHEINRESSFTADLIHTWELPDYSKAYVVEQAVHNKLNHLNANLSGFDGATEWFKTTPAHAADTIHQVMLEYQHTI